MKAGDVGIVNIYRSKIVERDPQVLNRLFKDVPAKFSAEVRRYKFWKDQCRSLLGRVLLKTGLNNLSDGQLTLDDVLYSVHGRPYVNRDIDFNISHSGDYVLCAITRNARLGIDVEQIRPVNMEFFRQILTQSQLALILEAEDPKAAFFRIWTMKESLMKADGRGFNLPMEHIEFKDGGANINGQHWFLREIPMDTSYACHLALNRPDFICQVTDLDFRKDNALANNRGATKI